MFLVHISDQLEAVGTQKTFPQTTINHGSLDHSGDFDGRHRAPRRVLAFRCSYILTTVKEKPLRTASLDGNVYRWATDMYRMRDVRVAFVYGHRTSSLVSPDSRTLVKAKSPI